MGVDKQDVANVAKISAAILAMTPAAAFAPIAGGIGKLLDKGNDSDEEHDWKVRKIPEWKKLCAGLMSKPMSNESRSRTLKDKINGDWFTHYGKRMKQSHLNKLHEDIVFAVKADLAISGL